VEGEVVLGVPGRVDRGEDVAGTDLDLVPVLQDPDALRRGRVEPSVEAVEERAVDLLGRRHQPGRVDQVAGAALVDVDRRLRERPGHVADPAGVVEVDVGHGHAGQVVGRDPEAVEGGEQRRDRALAARLDEHRAPAPRRGSRP
jgi:hypothetical protein